MGRPTPNGRTRIQQLDNLCDRHDSRRRQLWKAPRVAKPPKDGSDEPGLPRLYPLDRRCTRTRKDSTDSSTRTNDEVRRHQEDTTTGLQGGRCCHAINCPPHAQKAILKVGPQIHWSLSNSATHLPHSGKTNASPQVENPSDIPRRAGRTVCARQPPSRLPKSPVRGSRHRGR